MTGLKYKDVIENFTYFQKDNAPCHKCRYVEQYKIGQGIKCLSWPPYSPDLHVIDNVWSVLKRKMKQRLFNNFHKFKEAEIHQTCIASCALLLKRVNTCRKSSGGFINY